MESYIKKSTLIREFRNQIEGKPNSLVLKFDKPFFEIINRIFKKKPNDVRFLIMGENSLVFSIQFNYSIDIYLEHFIDRQPNTNTLVTITKDDDPLNSDSDMMLEDLNTCLSVIENLLSTKKSI